jgi:hypothetical protein
MVRPIVSNPVIGAAMTIKGSDRPPAAVHSGMERMIANGAIERGNAMTANVSSMRT